MILNASPPQRTEQEPVAWLCSPDENGLFELPTTHKACKDCFPVYTTLPQPAQEPIGYAVPTFDFDNSVIKKVYYAGTVPLYTTPPQRPWVGLTYEEIGEIHSAAEGQSVGVATGLTERKLKEKNNAA